jgi:hypothetical protein
VRSIVVGRRGGYRWDGMVWGSLENENVGAVTLDVCLRLGPLTRMERF